MSAFGLSKISDKPLEEVRKSYQVDSGKVSQISALRNEVSKVEKEQFGVCDTCVASYRSTIVENRILATELVKQNTRMQAVIDSNNAEIEKMQNALNQTRQKRKRYENILASN